MQTLDLTNTTTATTTDFNAWCDFITNGLDLLPDNDDSKQALTDDEE